MSGDHLRIVKELERYRAHQELRPTPVAITVEQRDQLGRHGELDASPDGRIFFRGQSLREVPDPWVDNGYL